MNKFALKRIAALAVATMLASSPSVAQTSEINEQWCGTGSDGAMNCLYSTLSECESVMRADGGECVPNPRVRAPEQVDD
jgi:hypothetical protein